MYQCNNRIDGKYQLDNASVIRWWGGIDSMQGTNEYLGHTKSGRRKWSRNSRCRMYPDVHVYVHLIITLFFLLSLSCYS